MRLLMYVLAVVVVLAIAMLCLRGWGHVSTAPAPQATEPTQTLAVPVPPAAPALLPEPPLPSPVTNVASAPPVADATLVTLEIVLSGQRGIPYEGTVRVDFFDMYKQYTSVRQTKQVHGEPALRFSNMPPIDCQITARLNGYLSTTTNVPLAEDAGTIKTVILQISPARELRGTVVDAKTKTPISYAGVALIADGTNTVCCDAAGVFAFNEVQDEIASLIAWHADYPNQQFSIFVPPDGTSSAVLEIMRAARIVNEAQPLPPPSNGWIHIIARGTAGEPVTNAIVDFVNKLNSTTYGAFDKSGKCVIEENVSTGDIALLCPGTPPLILTNVVVRYQETTTVHAVLCTLPTPVFGQARRDNGAPAAGICIYAKPEDGVTFGAQTDSRGEFSIPVARPDFLYKLTVNEVEIDQPREAIKPGDFVQVVLKPYSVVELQAVASNTMVYIASLNYSGKRASQSKSEFMRGGQAYNGMPHKIILPSSGAYWVTLKAKGYKPVTLQRTFLPDEDVQLGTVYFEQDAAE